MEIQTEFIEAETEEQKMAIQTCPGYDKAVEWVLAHTYEYEPISSHYRKCPERRQCKVEAIIHPDTFGPTVTIYDLCLME